jgi:para-aminobenzoate synthetase component 1
MGGQWASGLLNVENDPAALSYGGRWAVAVPYDGEPVLARFARWSPVADVSIGRWTGPPVTSWATSMDENSYREGVESVRDAIAAGTVYQANLCRVMSADLPDAEAADIAGLHCLLATGNPSPYGGFLRLPDHGICMASASPELFLAVAPADGGRLIASGPIKGTGATADDLTDKDRAENIMIVDLVRNDLSKVCEVGSVTVPALLREESHPGLVHLVSMVSGRLLLDVDWEGILEAAFPPGSVTGAPKSSALRLINQLEPVSREYYCGAYGWIDADTGEGELAVAIRTFWIRDGEVRFGTGAGITWASDASAEWRETELKARHLIHVASGRWAGGSP